MCIIYIEKLVLITIPPMYIPCLLYIYILIHIYYSLGVLGQRGEAERAAATEAIDEVRTSVYAYKRSMLY